MIRSTWFLALSAGCFLLTIPVLAQEAPPDSATIQAVTTRLRSDLRSFVVAQEAFYADHATYATSLREMGGMFIPSSGVSLVLLTASQTGHSEIAIDAAVPGLVCAMYVGSSPAPLGEGGEGEVRCRGP